MKKIYLFSLIVIFMGILGIGTSNTSAQNLATNPGFENWTDGTPDGWTIIDSKIIVTEETTVVHGGSKSAAIEDTTKDQSETDFKQPVNVEAGKSYALSIWVYHTDGGVKARWVYGPYGSYSNPSLTGQWQEMTATMVATETGPADIGLRFYDEPSFDGDEMVYLDDFSVTKLPDTDPPTWANNYPSISNIARQSFDLNAQLNESSTVYYVVLESGATEPTVAEIMAGTGSGGTSPVTAGSFDGDYTETTQTVDGLTFDVTYDVYVVAADKEATPNVQDAATKLMVTTQAPRSIIFSADFETSLDPFTAVNVLGDQVWAQDSYNNSGYAVMSGYSGGTNYDNEDWLISPAIDLDGSTANKFEFMSAMKYAGPTLQVMISSDFSGTYDATNVANATWTDISSSVTLSTGNWTWTPSGEVDLSSYSGTVYIAFKYTSNPTDGASTYEIDDFKVTGVLPEGSDATLSDLTVDGTTIEAFDAAVLDYTVTLPAGTTTVPTVGYTLNDPGATAVQTDATDLTGDAAARTTTIEVTAQDGSTKLTYTVLFNPILEVSDLAALRAVTDMDRTYTVTGEVVLTFQDGYRNKKYIQDASAAIEIDDKPGVITTDYNIGDGITGVTGTLENYYGYLRFHPVSDPGVATSTGNPVVPEVVTIADFKTNFKDYEAELVQLDSVGFADAGGAFANGDNYKVGLGNDTTVVRVHFYGTSLTGMSIPNKADVVGLAVWDYGEAKVAPRDGNDLTPYSSDATLTDLLVNDAAIGFDAATTSYDVVLASGTTDVPTVTYTTADAGEVVNVTDATNLTGTEAERTTTVEVISHDASDTISYNILFSVASTGIRDQADKGISLYPVPAADKLHITGLRCTQTIQIIDLVGAVVKSVTVTSNDAVIDISDLHSGMYLLRTDKAVRRFMKK